MKKLLLNLGLVAASIAPIATVVACGKDAAPETPVVQTSFKMEEIAELSGLLGQFSKNSTEDEIDIIINDALTKQSINKEQSVMLMAFIDKQDSWEDAFNLISFANAAIGNLTNVATAVSAWTGTDETNLDVLKDEVEIRQKLKLEEDLELTHGHAAQASFIKYVGEQEISYEAILDGVVARFQGKDDNFIPTTVMMSGYANSGNKTFYGATMLFDLALGPLAGEEVFTHILEKGGWKLIKGMNPDMSGIDGDGDALISSWKEAINTYEFSFKKLAGLADWVDTVTASSTDDDVNTVIESVFLENEIDSNKKERIEYFIAEQDSWTDAFHLLTMVKSMGDYNNMKRWTPAWNEKLTNTLNLSFAEDEAEVLEILAVINHTIDTTINGETTAATIVASHLKYLFDTEISFSSLTARYIDLFGKDNLYASQSDSSSVLKGDDMKKWAYADTSTNIFHMGYFWQEAYASNDETFAYVMDKEGWTIDSTSNPYAMPSGSNAQEIVDAWIALIANTGA